MLKIIDTPGLVDGAGTDSMHIIEIVRKLKTNFQVINGFLFVRNYTEIRVDESAKLMLSVFEANFGDKFWDSLVIAITRWSHSKKKKKMRDQQKISEASLEADLKVKLEADFPKSKGKNIKVVFTDTYEIKKDLSD